MKRIHAFKRWDKMHATPWAIDLAYSGAAADTIATDQFIEGVVGKLAAHSGSGFGLRDMQFDFGFRIWHKWQAQRAFKRLQRVYDSGFINFEYIEICEPYDYRDEEEEVN